MTIHIPELLLYVVFGVGGISALIVLIMLAWIGWKVTKCLGPPRW